MKIKIITALIALLFMIEVKLFALTLTGVDTILTNHECGYDFINQVACTTCIYSSGYDCYNHFWFFYNLSIGKFEIISNNGYGVQVGKINLDSIKTAPPDSIFNKIPQYIDSIPQDSLSSYVGNSYIIKSGVDPRDASIYFAKIRIVGFKMIDSASHTIVMRFLWACNVNNSRDISTSGLDTFNLPSTAIFNNPARNQLGLVSEQRILKIVGDKLTVPNKFVGTGRNITIYNLSGKLLFNKSILNTNAIDLRKLKGNSQNVLILRIEN